MSEKNEWAVVPTTMTLDMCVAFAEAWFSKVRCIDDPEMQDAYAAMLAASPTAPDAPLASMARAIFGDQIGGQMDAMAAIPSLSSLHGFAPGACDGMKSEDYVNTVRSDAQPCRDCTPAPSAPGDAQKIYHFEQRSRFGPWIEVEKPTAKSVEFVKRSDAPAAGDARALLDHPLLRDVLGYIEDAGPADVWGSAQSWMALRDAASQQQEG